MPKKRASRCPRRQPASAKVTPHGIEYDADDLAQRTGLSKRQVLKRIAELTNVDAKAPRLRKPRDLSRVFRPLTWNDAYPIEDAKRGIRLLRAWITNPPPESLSLEEVHQVYRPVAVALEHLLVMVRGTRDAGNPKGIDEICRIVDDLDPVIRQLLPAISSRSLSGPSVVLITHPTHIRPVLRQGLEERWDETREIRQKLREGQVQRESLLQEVRESRAWKIGQDEILSLLRQCSARVCEPEGNLQEQTPKRYLMGWPEILEALGLPHDAERRRSVRRINDMYQGPIMVGGQGSQARVERGRLIHWWNSLEMIWQDQQHQREGGALEAEAQHPYARKDFLAPEIGGAVKPRRKDRKP